MGEIKVTTGGAEKTRILKARAINAARALATRGSKGSEIELVAFRVGRETYAIERSNTREVHSVRELTPVPCTPPHIAGVVNIRGQIICVLDLKALFEIPGEPAATTHKVVVARVDGIEVGFVADEIVGVLMTDPSCLQDSLPTLTGVRADFIRGVADGSIVVLDVARMLNDPRVTVNDEVEA